MVRGLLMRAVAETRRVVKQGGKETVEVEAGSAAAHIVKRCDVGAFLWWAMQDNGALLHCCSRTMNKTCIAAYHTSVQLSCMIEGRFSPTRRVITMS